MTGIWMFFTIETGTLSIQYSEEDRLLSMIIQIQADQTAGNIAGSGEPLLHK